MKVPRFNTMEERQRFLRAVGEAHQEWEQHWLSKAPPLSGDHEPGSDYPLHHLTIDATGKMLDDFEQRIEQHFRGS